MSIRSRDRKSVISTEDMGEGPEDGSENQPSTNIFWDVNNYKRCIKRMEYGIATYDIYGQMFKERAQVEAAHAHALTKWAEKWQKHLTAEKTAEFGTLGHGFNALFRQALECAAVHTTIEQNLTTIVNKDLPEHRKSQYKKEFMTGYKEVKDLPEHRKSQYKKEFMTGYKEVKTTEKGFQKAQKPWTILKGKVDKNKKAYFTACANRTKLVSSVKAAEGDANFSSEDLAKLREKLSKATKDEELAKTKYERYVNEITADQDRYVREMTAVYQPCEAKENERIDFYKGVLQQVHKDLAMVTDQSYANHFDDLEKTVNLIDSREDAQAYSRERGIEMVMQWPQFEQWTGSEEIDTLVDPIVAEEPMNDMEPEHMRRDSFDDSHRPSMPPMMP
eukprot:Ihof_evm17s6 gene=Ihof_evmTU17s6